jgi:hypothetical protein
MRKGLTWKSARNRPVALIIEYGKVKVKFNLEQDMNGQTGKRSIALLFV